MTIEIFLVLLVIGGALFFFVTERLPVDITAFLILIVLMILGQFLPESFPSVSEGLSGLSSSATVTVLAMFILSAGIQRTGIISKLGRAVFSFVGNSEFRQILAILFIVAPISGFINNTAAVAILLPMVLDLSRRSGTPATKLLIPLSFFGMLGGTLTLIGTSTNILAASILKESGSLGDDIGLFEFTSLGLVVLFTGVVYFLTIGYFLLPNRKEKNGDAEVEDRGVFLAEIVIEKGHPAIGKTLLESKFEEKHDIRVLKLIREKKSYIKTLAEKTIEEGDILVIRAGEQLILELIQKEKVKLLPNFDEDARRLPAGTGKIVKVMLRGATVFHDRSLDEIGFWKKYNASVVGLQSLEVTSQRLGSVKLRVGETLLVQASLTSLEKLKYSKDFLLLETVEQEYAPEKMWITLGIVVAVVACSVVLGIPIVITALGGVVAMFLFDCLSKEEIYNAINWEIIFLLAGVIPLGVAMQKSGAAEFLAKGIIPIAEGNPSIVLILLLYVITTLLTEIISNNAAVVLIVPIAISVATEVHFNPLPLVLTVMFAASTSFLTPVGYQTNTMVYGSANYRFSDFFRVGAPLNILLAIVTSFFIWLWWL
ncbi:SLC13 family permease [Candidatus Peregrinibacteria bacterium]|nr:MAG: SLC13 family permease [Candidatus Peregrinibacteria bacterium]